MIKHNIPWINEKIINGIYRLFKEKTLTTGKYIKKFEKKLEDYTDIKYAITTSSGFMAIVCALLNIKKDKGYVAIPSYACAGVFQAVKFSGFKPLVVDVNPDTLTYDFADIKKIINKVDSVIVVDPFGMVNHSPELLEFKNRIIEDGATSIGHPDFGKFGFITTTSFYVTKTLGFCEGGALFTNNSKIYNKTRDIINPDRKDVKIQRINAKFTDYEAFIGINALKKLNSIIKRKRAIAKLYIKNIKSYKIITIDKKSTFHRFIIEVPDAAAFIKKLKKYRIEAKRPVMFIPHGFKNAMYLYKKLVSLPVHIHLDKSDILKICEVVEYNINV